MRRVWLSAVAALALVAETSAEMRVVQATEGDSGLALITSGGVTRVESARGGSHRLNLPSGSHLTSLAETADGWIAAGRLGDERGSELLLLEQRGGEIHILDAPGGREKARRGRPVPLVDGRRLAGVAWLEGDRQSELTVRAARRKANAWSPPEIVAGQGPGSQVALNGTVLRDGSWLLVWTAFNGTDDDTLWSLSSDDGWTAPRRLNVANDVPDIFPALVAHGDGALAAWSAYDGNDYRLHLARFTAGAWEELPVDSGVGSHLAGFVRHGSESLLLYRSVVPDGWSLLALDERGRVTHSARLGVGGTARPLVRRAPGRGSETVLDWPGSRTGTSTHVEEVIWRPAR